MVISLLVLLVPILLAFGIYRGSSTATTRSGSIRRRRSTTLSMPARFPVLVPTGLDQDWTTVSATFQTIDGGKALRFGMVSPDGEGAQVVQTTRPPTDIIPAELTRDARTQGNTEIAGVAWQIDPTRPGEHAYREGRHRLHGHLVGGASEADLTDPGRLAQVI